MFRRYDQSQPFLLPPSLQDFVEEGHPAHVINDLRASTCPFLLSGWMALLQPLVCPVPPKVDSLVTRPV